VHKAFVVIDGLEGIDDPAVRPCMVEHALFILLPLPDNEGDDWASACSRVQTFIFKPFQFPVVQNESVIYMKTARRYIPQDFYQSYRPVINYFTAFLPSVFSNFQYRCKQHPNWSVC
jgi:hypothetical protein